MIADFYEDFAEIGRGSFGSIFRAFDKRSRHAVAIKIIDKSICPQSIISRVRNLIPSLLALDHPFIVHYYEWFEDDSRLYIVMEYIANGTLLTLVNSSGRLSDHQIKVYALQMVEVLEYLHNESKIIHRDLKTENFLIDRFGNLRLADFGFAKSFSGNQMIKQTVCGSPSYAAPEIVMNSEYNSSVDIWSIGVILYAMAYGKLPFEASSIASNFQQILLKEPEYNDEFVPHELNDLISKMLCKSPKNRITLEQIRKHPFMLNFKIPIFKVYNPSDLSKVVLFHMTTKLNFDENDLTLKLQQNKISHDTAVYKILNTDRICLDLNSYPDFPRVPIINRNKFSRTFNAKSTTLKAGRSAAQHNTRSSPTVFQNLNLASTFLVPIRKLKKTSETPVHVQNMPTLRRRTRGNSINFSDNEAKKIILPSIYQDK